MGTTKTRLFTEEANAIANFARAIAHPARITIINRLLQTETCVCGDFVEDLGLAQSTVSQHLLALKKAGIIQGTVQGPSTCYCLNPEKWNELKNSLGNFIHQEVALKSMCC
ncbi:ArsR/SmtB family transcription factor [Psychroflexus planctonicus]|uniref:Transcriptional regulator n=1 Tax=Psychroflexus planctonicus TaxID=1526575 RepID=A0ABQ1SK32_9FLAO|nr:metalloregulator ArsR/SmtB family transcription factor [Psychroflexus planctonicus]GGE43893.1 transcriptional regulator [Psychroflexus planctonicus]